MKDNDEPLHVRAAKALGLKPQLVHEIMTAAGSGTAISFETREAAEAYLAKHGLCDHYVATWEHYPHLDPEASEAILRLAAAVKLPKEGA